MIEKRNMNLVCIVNDLTPSQASKLSSKFIRAKHIIAPFNRGTTGIVTKERIGTILQNGTRMISTKKK